MAPSCPVKGCRPWIPPFCTWSSLSPSFSSPSSGGSPWPADVARIAAAATQASAEAVLTTDKDAVRFAALGPLPFALFRVPLAVRFEPEDVLFGSVREMLRRRAAGEGVA